MAGPTRDQGSATGAVRDWSEAVVKFNRLILRPTAQTWRQAVPASISPISLDDLINLNLWNSKDSYIKTNEREAVERL